MPNTPNEIKKFFSEGAEPVTMKEFNEFWKSCSDEDKNEFRNADLS